MKKGIIVACILILILSILSGGFWLWKQRNTQSTSCDIINLTEKEVRDVDFIDTSSLSVVSSDCKSPKKGDFIVFKTALSKKMVIKKLVAVPGDTLKITSDSKLKVNGKVVQGIEDSSYEVATSKKGMFELYTGELTGYIVIGKSRSLDSGRFGAIGKESIQYVLPQENI